MTSGAKTFALWIAIACAGGLGHWVLARTFGPFAPHRVSRIESPDRRFALVLICRSRVNSLVNGEGCVDPSVRLETATGRRLDEREVEDMDSDRLLDAKWETDSVRLGGVVMSLPR